MVCICLNNREIDMEFMKFEKKIFKKFKNLEFMEILH